MKTAKEYIQKKYPSYVSEESDVSLNGYEVEQLIEEVIKDYKIIWRSGKVVTQEDFDSIWRDVLHP